MATEHSEKEQASFSIILCLEDRGLRFASHTCGELHPPVVMTSRVNRRVP